MSQPTIYDPQQKVWMSPEEPIIFNPHQSVGNLILNMLRLSPEQIIQISADSGATLTCKELHDRTILLAQYLTQCCINENDFVGFVASNSENLAPTIFACFVLGITVVPLSPITSQNDLIELLTKTMPKILFCDERNLRIVQSTVNEMKMDIKIYTIMEKVEGYECVSEILMNSDYGNVYGYFPPKIDSQQIAGILCTSGSTGIPKMVPKSHHDLITHFYQCPHPFREYSARFLQLTPIFWICGFDALIYLTIALVTRVITTQQLNAEVIVKLIKEYEITDLSMPPFLVYSILEVKNLEPMQCIKAFIVSGTKVTQLFGEKLKEFIPNGEIYIIYGMTERSGIAMNLTRKYNSCGYLKKGFSVKIIDYNGKCLGPKEHGEICLKEDVPFRGYYKNPEKSAEVIKDGWFHTGDIGYFDDENHLHVEERKEELMRYEGYYIIPMKLEALINSIEGVINSYIVATREIDSENSLIHAFVIADEKAEMTQEKILQHVHSKVIDQLKIRGGVHFVSKFPMLGNGKIDRKKLQIMVEKMEEMN